MERKEGGGGDLASLIMLILVGPLSGDVCAIDAENLQGGGFRQRAVQRAEVEVRGSRVGLTSAKQEH